MERSKHKNGIRHPAYVKERARQLRKEGFTHREIKRELNISLGSAYLWSKSAKLSYKQKEAIQLRRNLNAFPPERREKLRKLARTNLQSYWKPTPTDSDLLQRIQKFYKAHGRIPLKREFNTTYIEYKRRFGGWNNAVQKAGFHTNPILFSDKHKSIDGHLCDSLAEKIVDDYLYKNKVCHKRNIYYPGSTKLKADFVVKDLFIEYFGLAGELDSYDKSVEKKKKICTLKSIKLIEIYPRHLFPKNRLGKILSSVL